ncbi:metallophosphoesterase [Thalassoroseus pseudoceratinae]|uniref:metallophosphoesterase n=1 Tax=Thalassoroseus pseudoceratinae TaxID=2713176 RepID=UPI00141F1C00|nr:metallophosphoesterase [Thalassoroseus pseudoceratinae]
MTKVSTTIHAASHQASRVFAIGDIHGCARALEALLAALPIGPFDIVVPLGDVIDRGNDSRAAIELLMSLSSRCDLRPILGNHEEMMLDVLDGKPPKRWLKHGGTATLDSYGFCGRLDVIPQEHIDFIRSFSDIVELEDHFFVHGNYDSQKPLSEQSRKMMRWTSLIDHLPMPHQSGKAAVVGHTANKTGNILRQPGLTCIDTGCYGGGCLTALEVYSGEMWQASFLGKVTAPESFPQRQAGA